MKIKRHITMLVVEAEGDDAKSVLEAYNSGLELARDAIAAGTPIDRKRTMNGVMQRVAVKVDE
jgi:hypothetical protein